MENAELRSDEDIQLISDAVQAWYRFYEISPDDTASETLCAAAIGLFNDGCRSSDDIATMLIGTFVGRWFTRANAPTSNSSH